MKQGSNTMGVYDEKIKKDESAWTETIGYVRRIDTLFQLSHIDFLNSNYQHFSSTLYRIFMELSPFMDKTEQDNFLKLLDDCNGLLALMSRNRRMNNTQLISKFRDMELELRKVYNNSGLMIFKKDKNLAGLR